MGTFKRAPFEIDTTVRNGSRYLNQMQFNGIVQNNNTYDVDQNSLTDALNVYVNDQNTLVSREPLIKDNMYVPYPTKTVNGKVETYGILVDIKECNGVKVFEFKNENEYIIVAYKNGTSYRLTCSDKYKIVIHNQYIICFRTEGAQVFDTQSDANKWDSLRAFADKPITKITTGSDVEKKPINLFTDAKQEHYVITNDIKTILPEGDASYYTGEYITTNTVHNLEVDDPWKLTDYRFLKAIELEVPIDSTTGVSIAGKTIAIGLDDYFLVSFDAGKTFTKVQYPRKSIYAYSIKELTKAGDAYFVAIENYLYYCNLSTFTWSMVSSDVAGAYRCGVFENKSSWAARFRYGNTNQIQILLENLAGKRNVISTESVKTGGSSWGNTGEYDKRAIDNCSIGTVFAFKTANGKMSIGFVGVIGGDYAINTVDTGLGFSTSDAVAMTIRDATYNSSDPTIIRFKGEVGRIGGACKRYEAVLTNFNSTTTAMTVTFTLESVPGTEFPILIKDDVYITTYGYDISVHNEKYSGSLAEIDGQTIGEENNYDIITSANHTDGEYIVFDKDTYTIYTNAMGSDDSIIIKYIYSGSSSYYKEVPSIAYSSTELLLGFGNELKITKNTKDGSNTLFNLPEINNQSFANDIKAIINISTTELAIFFENGITICSKVADDVTGYRYDYAKTRLTLGTKFGDSVINTADGASTLYATPRGLAIMNYQAYMATTDQTLQFISDKIYAVWNKFYLNSENITLIQHGDYVFVYNTSNKYLMLDLRNYSWWKFEIPFNIKKLLTDQIELKVISDNLYKFKQVNNGTDKIEDDYVDDKYYDVGNEPIRWMFMSQRLHFNLPNHYKNMKQLVFHLVQSTGHISTFNAQIKLYRNSVNYKDMEVIPFDFNFAVDEFRTFVKRFNYWKINMLQYGVANDDKAAVPARLVCNGVDIKYEIGDEVR